MPTETDTQTPDQAAPGTGQAAPGTGEQTDWRAKAEEWQRRFTGLQGTFQREQGKLAEAQAKLLELNEQLTSLTGAKEALALEAEKYRTQATTTLAERDTLKGQLDRLGVLMQFPALMSLEQKGLLPAGSGDDLRAKLAELQKTLQSQGIANTLPEGATPPGPNPAKKDRAALMAEVRRYQAEGKTAEYNQAYDALLQLDAK
jgi:hypothetical protein